MAVIEIICFIVKNIHFRMCVSIVCKIHGEGELNYKQIYYNYKGKQVIFIRG